jgi:hypothetical protein
MIKSVKTIDICGTDLFPRMHWHDMLYFGTSLSNVQKVLGRSLQW